MINPTDDQRALLDGLSPWCAVLSADHVERDAAAAFPHDKWKIIQDCGILRLPFDPAWGGLGQDLTSTMYVLDGLGNGCRDGGLNFAVSTHLASTGVPLARFGSAALKDRYLPGVCAGETIGAHAITESDGGSDALTMRTTAVRNGDDFVLNGSKAFVSNGPVADLFVVYARTDRTAGPLGITAFLVERDTPGLVTGRPIAKMGLHSAPLCEMFLDDCRVPADQVLGRPGSGFLILDHVMKREILFSFVISLGEMRHRLERCIGYARDRTQFGRPIGTFQAIAHKIVKMKVDVETTEHFLYAAANRLTETENVAMEIAMAKLVASECNVASALAAVQIFGGNGYLAEYGLEKDLRDAVGGTIYSGTSEVQRNRIASMLGL